MTFGSLIWQKVRGLISIAVHALGDSSHLPLHVRVCACMCLQPWMAEERHCIHAEHVPTMAAQLASRRCSVMLDVNLQVHILLSPVFFVATSAPSISSQHARLSSAQALPKSPIAVCACLLTFQRAPESVQLLQASYTQPLQEAAPASERCDVGCFPGFKIRASFQFSSASCCNYRTHAHVHMSTLLKACCWDLKADIIFTKLRMAILILGFLVATCTQAQCSCWC